MQRFSESDSLGLQAVSEPPCSETSHQGKRVMKSTGCVRVPHDVGCPASTPADVNVLSGRKTAVCSFHFSAGPSCRSDDGKDGAVRCSACPSRHLRNNLLPRHHGKLAIVIYTINEEDQCRAKQTVPDIFILNLSIVDLLFLLGMPFLIHQLLGNVAICLAFFTCWAPYYILQLVHLGVQKPSLAFSYAYNIAISMGYANSCINPFLYIILSETFKRQFLRAARLAQSPPCAKAHCGWLGFESRPVALCRTSQLSPSMSQKTTFKRKLIFLMDVCVQICVKEAAEGDFRLNAQSWYPVHQVQGPSSDDDVQVLDSLGGCLRDYVQVLDSLRGRLRDYVQVLDSLRGRLRDYVQVLYSLRGRLRDYVQVLDSLRGRLRDYVQVLDSLRGRHRD
ncbi:Melanin-concentrating hormone receptor 1 [Nibea albiflora]|uniref:Melanin-concentrating hormone receptor 1 n=1 Tax=Nibea albiflora TaxID=240163 RepID=A0ACB7FM49_NIBAL|nr:Melanin-concentrating hormone receptor 1 [Nibea albiflora]